MGDVSPIRLASRRNVLTGAAAAALTTLAACGKKEAEKAPNTPTGPPEGSLEWAVAGPWRSPEDRARDAARHPMETLRFFGLQPKMKVVEFWPGSGWYAEILAPYLKEGGGEYYAAGFQTGPGADPAQTALMTAFRQHFESDRRLYGEVQFTAFGPASPPVAPAGTIDLALFMRGIHAWMAAGVAEKAFADAYEALRPGGVLGIEQHRLSPDEDQDPVAANGYVQEAFVKQLAAEAGFVFVAASEINANETDTKDHPFGVESLAPQRRSQQGDKVLTPEERAALDAIGESDRMTLKFRKPE